jgi:hypothetical protein
LPITLKKESLILIENQCLYIIHNDFINKETTLIVDKIVSSNKVNVSRIVMPIVRIPSLKNRDLVFNKIKTYILFS